MNYGIIFIFLIFALLYFSVTTISIYLTDMLNILIILKIQNVNVPKM